MQSLLQRHLLRYGAVGEDGLPYLAMEYVAGRPITEYCDAERLTVEQRLRLFLAVCSAVQYAHRNLVAHRDLKPSNILVTADGEVKLLDFGIAKLLAPDEPGDLAVTQTVLPRLTLEYAAPEQVRGEPVTTATDVYALGLLLHGLLCGKRAQAVSVRTPAAIERSVCEQQPPPPSMAFATGASTEVAARLERAFEINERVLGPDHRDLASPLNNLAILHWQQGELEAAKPLFERALALWERDLGPDHPSVAHVVNNLALLYNLAGRARPAARDGRE